MKAAKIVFETALVCVFFALAPQHASAETAIATPQLERAEYPDLPKGHWAYAALEVLSRVGIIEGRPGGIYEGNKPMTRYEFAVAVARIRDNFGDDPARFQLPTFPNKPAQAGRLEAIDAITALCTEFRFELERIGVRDLKKWQLQ